MKRVSQNLNNQRGVALLTAIALLLVFTVLGSAYLRYMSLETEKARMAEARVRANHAVEGAVYAAVDQIKKALAEKKIDALIKQTATTMVFPSYSLSGGEQLTLINDENVQVTARWAVRDESGKLNLNHAPASALRVILGVDGSKAREIRASLPRSEEGAGQAGDKRWFSTVNDVVTSGLISPDVFKTIDLSNLTVYTVPDPDQPYGYINLNTASPKVLEAVLDISPDMANTVAAARPFRSLADVCHVAGKPATMFNFKPEPETPDSMPKALSLESNAFRVFASAQVRRPGGGSVLSSVSVEAVVVLLADGGHVFTFWQMTGGDRGEPLPEAASSQKEANSADEVNTAT